MCLLISPDGWSCLCLYARGVSYMVRVVDVCECVCVHGFR
jgi:hypothetical protein